MSSMDRYRYQVTPYSPISDLIPGKSLRKPFTSELNKAEVLLCMKHGPVFRVFPDEKPIRVTGSNIDSLHVNLIEWVSGKKLTEDSSVSTETITETVPEQESTHDDVNLDIQTYQLSKEELNELVKQGAEVHSISDGVNTLTYVDASTIKREASTTEEDLLVEENTTEEDDSVDEVEDDGEVLDDSDYEENVVEETESTEENTPVKVNNNGNNYNNNYHKKNKNKKH